VRFGGASVQPLAGLAAVVALLMVPGGALAQEIPGRLILAPIGQPGAYFDLTMRPGDRRTLELELGDASTEPIVARTYAADVYTIVNGGFGGRLRDEPATAMTGWLDYSTSVLELHPGDSVRRSFTITVPKAAGPGEYITSIVLENDVPIAGTGPVALDQVTRQAVAVVVDVPGARRPALAIGAASHEIVAGASVVSVAVANPGNVRLKPMVGFRLFDAAGHQVSATQFQMDTFYSWTASSIEVPLAAILLPGAYTIALDLDDAAHDVHVVEPAIPLLVVAPAVAAPVVGGVPELPSVDQASPGREHAVPIWALGVGVGAGLVLAAAIGLSVRRRQARHRGR
jgi:hypothetical protein